jgi:hypothetical protein
MGMKACCPFRVIVYMIAQNAAGAKIPEACYGADLTGNAIPGELFGGGERTQHLLLGIADFGWFGSS